ncbi:hypothetical protein V6N13_083452 [Hibiscus sabdariffa]
MGESLDDFSEDEENIVSVTKDDDVHLLDADDVEAIMTDAKTKQPIPSYQAYEPPVSMHDVDYIAMRDREHEARVFGSSSSSNYGELVLKDHFETKKRSTVGS